ncbi:MAG: alpha/beta hydrolase family protein [Pyrinomonadaceae bacterium]
MKKAAQILITLFTALTAYGQDISGQWNGVMDVQGVKLRVGFNITKTETGYVSTMDSPDQGRMGIPLPSTSFKNFTLKIEYAEANIQYEGHLNKENVFEGKFSQGGQNFPLNLSRAKAKLKPVRPQEPKAPFPYYTEDVTFENTKDKIVLAGTLTLPKKDGNFPALVLITGSGPQNRDEEIFGHKPFLLLADYLTRSGIAVLRFDDRGVAASKGNYETATTLDFSYDVESAVNYLKTRKEINKKKLGLIGHSEGGQIAPMIAARSADIDFIVMLAGPGLPGDQLLLLQGEFIGRSSGLNEASVRINQTISAGAYEIVKRSTTTDALKTELTNYLNQAFSGQEGAEKPPASELAKVVTTQVNQLASPWLLYFIKLDPSVALGKVKCPVLALGGSNDLQVPAKANLATIKLALEKGGNKNVTTIEFPGLNHLFQESKTGLKEEYGKIEQTMSPLVLEAVSKWIKKQVD